MSTTYVSSKRNRSYTILDPEEKFWANVEPLGSAECWVWKGARTPSGYGRIRIGTLSRRAHRIGYELLVGLVPAGLELDHLCRNRPCVNPAHLEPVTRRENQRRSPITHAGKTHCSRGHRLAGDNISKAPPPGTRRRCLVCHRQRERERWMRKRALAA